MVSMSRMPPPSCTGMDSPTALTMREMAPSFLGLPATAPFRSTTCRRCAPWASQCLATASGSSEKVVASCMSPCFRRTQWPSLMSIAGMMSIAGRIQWKESGRERPKKASGIPVDEIVQQLESGGVAFLRVELYRKNILPRYSAAEGEAIVRLAAHHGAFPGDGVVGMHEVEALAAGDVPPQRVVQGLGHPVPAHVRHLEPGAVRPGQAAGKAAYLAGEDAQAIGRTLFAPFKQHLQPYADAEKGLGP